MTMANINDKIAKAITKGYETTEHIAVNGYKKTESAAIKGWKKTENFFVGKFFKKNGETTQEAKERLQKNDNHN
ncbi:hypothetical protein [Streptococcus macacae]|uniref:Phage protein n=1 Tax=Streptococcus macacae NCTC 11558 TaxID=764298 RepID=G5JUN3_9STRE|nr:hypothetical protein [Streptococcus macacae]EHJ52407.1 hypothetical protein STRMA_1023 [Streptococcus macacae NCTC 11558]SUN78850.1 Uncharacterised protein [Streptococcus macacae NCTC 11558]